MTLTRIWRRAIRNLSRRFFPESPRKVIHTRINDYNLLVLANEDVGRAIHFGHSYESSETAYLRKIITPDTICLDVGANVGYFSMLMAALAYRGNVYAFDPLPLNAALLRASAELNDFKNIKIIESAVGASDGEVSLTQSTDSAYSSIRDTKRKAVERIIRVPMITLDTFITNYSIQAVDVIKIDVEGAEGLVLNGSRALLSDAVRRPRVILMELVEENLRSYDTCATAIIDIMRSFSYTPFFISSAAELTPFRMEKLEEFYNVLFLDPRSKGND